MTIDFGYEIKADGAQALATSDKVEAGLDAIEKKAKSTGTAIGTAMRDAQGRFLASGVEAEKTASSIEDLNKALGVTGQTASVSLGQLRIIESLNAPLRTYTQGLRDLDGLLQKDMITTEQYAQQVLKLNQALDRSAPKIGETPITRQYGPTFDPAKAGGTGPSGGGGGEGGGLGLGGAAATLGIGLGVGAAVAGLKELSSAIIDSSDRWTEMTNSVRKFTDANHSVDDVIRQQREIGLEIRASTTEAIALYDRVHNATASLYLSTGTVVDITKTLGLVAKENNTPLEAVEGTLKRLAFAADTGKISTRELKTMFASMPELSRVLAASFHTTQAGFDELATSGKISARDIYLAIASYLPQAADKIKDFGKTSKDEVQEWYLKTYQGVDLVKSEYEQWIDQQKKNKDAQEQQNLTLKMGEDALASFTHGLELTRKAGEMMFTDELTNRIERFSRAITDAKNKANQLNADKTVIGAGASLGLLPAGLDVETQREAKKATEEATFAGEGYGKTIQTLVVRADDLHDKIEDLRAGMASGKLTTDQYNLAAKELAQTLKSLGEGTKSALEKMEDKLLKPFKDYRLELAAIQALQVKMPQYADLWAEELEKITAKNPGMLLLEATIKRHVAAYDAAAKAAAEWQRASGGDLQNRPGFLSESSFLNNDDPLAQKGGGGRFRNDALRDAQAAQAGYDAGQAALEKREAANEQQRLALMNQFADAGDAYRNEVLKINDAEKDGLISEDQRIKYLDLTRQKYNDVRPQAEQFTDALKKLDDETAALGLTTDEYRLKYEQLAKQFNQDPLAQFTSQLRTDANTTTLEVNLLKTGFDDLAKGIYDVAITGKQSISDLTSSVVASLAQMILKAELAKITLSLLGLGTPSIGGALIGGALGGAGGGVGHYATGGSGFVGGSGGTDSVPFIAMTTPGEHFEFTPPGQIPGWSHSGGQAPVIVETHTHVHNHYDPRELVSAIGGDDGQRQVFNVVNKQRGAIRKALQR